jgi:uncharacterized delta-60 repeat protein
LVHQFGLGSSPFSQGGGVVAASDGDIYQAGSASAAGGSYQLYLARYLPDGTLDSSFGTGGVVYENVGAGSAAATALPALGPAEADAYVALTPSGNPVVLTDTTLASGGQGLAVLEFTQTGQLDDSFASAGVYRVPLGGPQSNPGGLAVDANGDIVFTGMFLNSSSYEQFVAGRLTDSGAVDGSFGSNGLLEPDFGAGSESLGTGVITQSNGDLAFAAFVAASGGTGVDVIRATPSGQLDGSFGTGGVARVADAAGLALNPGLVETADGGYAIASSTMSGSPAATTPSITRLTAAGDPDTSFGSGGTALVVGSGPEFGMGGGAFVQADGKLIVTGFAATTSGEGPFVARLSADGTLDVSFAAGVNLTPIAGSFITIPVEAAETPDGNLLQSGTADLSSPESFLQETNLDTAPTTSFAYAPTSIQVGTPVQFSAAASANDGYSIGGVSWDFGSGSFGAATGATVSHTFTTPGTYTVRVQATDSFGLSTVSTQTITVSAAPATPTAPNATTTITSTASSTQSVTPALKAAPKLRLLSIKVKHGKLIVKLGCAGAACKVSSGLTTLEHLISGKTASLSSGGHGKHTRSVKIGSLKLTLQAGQTRTFTVKLNRTGRKLMAAFHRIPSTASFKLTNGQPAKTIKHKIRIH